MTAAQRPTGNRLTVTLLALAAALAGLALPAAAGRVSADTATLLPYSSGGFRYEQVATGDGAGFEAPAFDDSAWATGAAPFGYHAPVDNCPLDSTIVTPWSSNTDLLVRHAFTVSDPAAGATVAVAMDNGADVWVNGHDISSGIQLGDNCAARDQLVLPVPPEDLVAGSNVLAVRARDLGDDAYLDVEVRATVPDATTTQLTSSLNPSVSTQAVTFTATVRTTTGGKPATAGSLAITDETTSTQLASADPIAGNGTLAITVPGLAIGTHHVVATFTGAGAFASSSASIDQQVNVDAAVLATGLSSSPSTFYPIVDGYLDTETIRGRLGESATVTIRIYATSTGKLVRTVQLGSRDGAYAYAWNGRTAGGTLLAAGKYRIVQTLVDTASNRLTATTYAVLSQKKLVWSTWSASKAGAQYAVAGDPGDGWVRTSASSYSHGVKLTSGHSWAAVAYTFSIPAATRYGTMTWRVTGRSTNGTGAVIAIWNPSLGSWLSTGSYDAAKATGSTYARYSTSAAANPHRSGRTAHTIVYVQWIGKAMTFDVATVSLSVRYAVLK